MSLWKFAFSYEDDSHFQGVTCFGGVCSDILHTTDGRSVQVVFTELDEAVVSTKSCSAHSDSAVINSRRPL